jgi:ABC-2 type transport system permease protein
MSDEVRASIRASRNELVKVPGTGWLTGMPNLLRKELREWFGGITLLWTSLIWLGITDGIMLITLLSELREGAEAPRLVTLGVEVYCNLTAMFAAVGVVIAVFDAIVGERELGTAAFLLSKPVSRAAFILSKFTANAIGVLVTSVLIPGIVAYIEIWAIAGVRLPIGRFGVAMLILFVGLAYFLAMTLLCGSLFKHKGPVIGIPMAFIFGMSLLIQLIPQLAYLIPWDYANIARAYMLEGTVASVVPLIAVPLGAVLFLAVAILAFEKEDI